MTSTATATLRLGTRASALARTQSQAVADAVTAATGRPVELVHISTEGDRSAAAIAQLGGTGVFVTAIRQALEAGEVVDAELLRLSGRLPGLDARAREEIARTVHRVVDKLLHEPTVRVKELADRPGGTDYASALRALFGLAIDADVEDDGSLASAVTVDPEEMA